MIDFDYDMEGALADLVHATADNKPASDALDRLASIMDERAESPRYSERVAVARAANRSVK